MIKYKNKNIAIINSTAIAYSGVSSCIEDMIKWSNTQDINIDVFHYEAKKQKQKSEDGFNYDYTEFTIEDTNEIVELINSKYDYVILMTESKIRKQFSKEFYRNFLFNFWKKINCIKIRMQHDATRRAIALAPFNLNISNEADAIFTISKTSEYVKDIEMALPSKRDKIYKYDLWLNFEMFDEWKKNEVQKDNKITSLGRYASFKNPERLFCIAQELKELGLTIEIHGFDSSIASVGAVLSKDIVNDYVRNNIRENGIINVYSKYKRLDGLDKMRHSLFGYSFFSYNQEKDKGFYGNRLEYAQQEVIACGAIPIYDKDWGENCKTRDGVKYIDIPYFAIFCEKNREADILKEIEKVLNDKDLQKKYVDTSYKTLKENYDMNIILPEFFNNVCSVQKDENKFKTEYDMAKYITNDSEVAKKYQEMIDNEDCLSYTDYKKLSRKEVCVYGGKSGKANVIL